MEHIWRFFEYANYLVYAVDIRTCEIVYMNKQALEAFGCDSVAELKGKKCHEVIHGGKQPCAVCNNEELYPGRFVEKTTYSHILNAELHHFMTYLTDKGRKFRLDMISRVATDNDANRNLSRLEYLEAKINKGIRQALAEPDPDAALNVLLSFLGKAVRCDRVTIFEKDSAGYERNTYEWTAPGIPSQMGNLARLPATICADWYEKFRHDKYIKYENVELLRHADPEKYRILKLVQTASLIVLPIFAGEEIIGFYGVDNPPPHDLDYAINLLQILGSFISAAIKRRNMVNELKTISFQDQLTGLGNRHALHQDTDMFKNGAAVGVAYCDVTGLKQVNDEQGHMKGDELILKAATSLKDVFGAWKLYRIGGDEFVAICPGISSAELDALTAKLLTDSAGKGVNLAIGAAYEPEYEGHMDQLLNDAEKRMYAAKSEFYQSSGLDRRRNYCALSGF